MSEIFLDSKEQNALVGRFFAIDSITLGDPAKNFIVRYSGRLRVEDSAAAYDQLAELLKPYQITPLFRLDEDGGQAVLLVSSTPDPKPSNQWVNLGLFLATLISMVFAGGLFFMKEAPVGFLPTLAAIIQAGLPFALGLILILGTHEFGHYLVGRLHGVHVTLPYFIPFPLPPFGTLGAFINMKDQPKNRRHLLDIGLAGPLSGLIVAIPVLLVGLSLSLVEPIPLSIPKGSGMFLEGNSIFYLLFKYLAFGKWLPEPLSTQGLPPLLYWVMYFFSGRPFPFGALDVSIHPLAMAGWAGLLVTAMNLIPAGQLDGGHALFVLIGRKRMARLFPFIMGILVLLGLAWPGWWLWAALLFFFGRSYAEPLDEITPLDTPRKVLAIFAILLFFLVFIPVPMVMMY